MLAVPLASCGEGDEAASAPTPTPMPTATPMPSPGASTYTATVSSPSGEVLVSAAGVDSWLAASHGMKVGEGDGLKTGSDGYTMVLFHDGSVMEVESETEILIEKLDVGDGGSTLVRLTQIVGDTMNRVESLVDSESQYEIDTEAGLAVVRGTVFGMEVERYGLTCCNVSDGCVEFSHNGKTVEVCKGTLSCCWAGGVPCDPFIIDPARDPLNQMSNDENGGGAVVVTITNPLDGSEEPGGYTQLQGTVVSQQRIVADTGTLTHNGIPVPLPLGTPTIGSFIYNFDVPLALYSGANNISVSATDVVGTTGSDSVSMTSRAGDCDIVVRLTWDTAYDDLDAHFIAPCQDYEDSFYDCYYMNENPDWDGVGGEGTTGDPALDYDETEGYGPEYTSLCAPPFNGGYDYKVHFYSDDSPMDGALATVMIWVRGFLVFNQTSSTLYDDEVWDAACIDWPSGTVTAGPCPTCTPTPTPSPIITPTPTPTITPTPIITPTPTPTVTPTPIITPTPTPTMIPVP